ncbi:cysteine--tRNA ligase [Candida albicans]|uniref:cysteine--tRNA ligase n=1 Tax=Candida albicans TaxID=5476 RepID=A0A8H6F515_CANAX|nr:cysteine--tRNA ligase [Candida albicans]
MSSTTTTSAAKKPTVKQPQWYQPENKNNSKPTLKIYNSLTRSKNEFYPNKPGHITWYSCGPTVYDHSHMGHARNYVSTDICRRILQDYFGYNIKFVQNVTDIDDKIIIAARQQYLFEEKLVKNYKEINDELKTKAKDNEIKNLSEIIKDKPKFPMYVKAAKLAHESIYETKDISLEKFLDSIKDVAMPHLDKEFGATVTDPQVFRKLPSYWEKRYNEDMARLNVLPPSVTTRVSEYMPDIIEFVDKIVTNGYAYKTDDGRYELINDGEGSLSVSNTKRNASDFALWKASKPGEPAWDSKWGKGRPGWHIECSVMASDITGENMDIHSGGIDLCFPHHDNELAQSEAYFDNKQWVNYFMHNGHLHIQGQKIKTVEIGVCLECLGKPLDFKDSLISEVKSIESTFSKFFTNVRALNSDYKHKTENGGYVSRKITDIEKQLFNDLEQAQDEVDAAFNDNLSSGQAIRVLQDLISKSNNYIQLTSTGQTELRIEVLIQVTNWIVKILEILGFEARSDRLGWIDESEQTSTNGSSTEDVALPYVKALAQFRDSVRSLAINKAELNEFLKASDAIRSSLIGLGVSLDDRPDGTSLVKFLNAQEKQNLLDQQEAKLRLAAEKEKKKQEQAALNAKKEAEKLAKMKINPSDLFKDTSLYSEWDEQGLPTKDAKGEEISKSMKKKLTKQYQQQEKLYKEYLKTVEEAK